MKTDAKRAHGLAQVMATGVGKRLEDYELDTWAQVMQDMSLDLCVDAADHFVRTATFMPKTVEFIEYVRKLEADEQRHRMARDRTMSSFRCDGTGWRCARCKQTECHVECDNDKGYEPCPSCRPQQYELLSDPDRNAAWRNGKASPEMMVAGPACTRFLPDAPIAPPALASLAKSEEERWRKRFADTDWSTSRRDLE